MKFSLTESIKHPQFLSYISTLTKLNSGDSNTDVFSNPTSSKKKYKKQIAKLANDFNINPEKYSVHHMNGIHSDNSPGNVVFIPTEVHNKINDYFDDYAYNRILSDLNSNNNNISDPEYLIDNFSKVTNNYKKGMFYLQKCVTALTAISKDYELDLNKCKLIDVIDRFNNDYKAIFDAINESNLHQMYAKYSNKILNESGVAAFDLLSAKEWKEIKK